jgi:hypothetical protein
VTSNQANHVAATPEFEEARRGHLLGVMLVACQLKCVSKDSRFMVVEDGRKGTWVMFERTRPVP